MKRILALAMCLILGIGCFADAGEPNSSEYAKAAEKIDLKIETKNYIEGQALVTLAVPAGEQSDLLQTGSLHGDRSIQIKRVHCFDDAAPLGKTAQERKSLQGKDLYISYVTTNMYTTKQLKSFLKKYSYVLSVTPNYKTHKFEKPNDPFFDEQWHLGGENYMPGYCYAATVASGSAVSGTAADFLPDTPIKDSSVVPASSIGYTPEEKQDLGDKTPIVAIIDDGVDYKNEDLKNMMWVNPYKKKDLPGKYGYDTLYDKDDPYPAKGDDHGTQIAGIIAAESDNNYGIAGICKNVKLMSLKVYNGDEGAFEAEIAAYEYIYKAMKLGANVVAVNCSFGTGPSKEEDPQLSEAISPYDVATKKLGAMGAVTVFAAGNAAADTDEEKWGIPMQLDRTYMINVGSTVYTGKPASFTNYGAKSVDIFAPGDLILSYRYNNRSYIPQSYDEATRSKLCLFYEDFSDYSNDRIKTIEDVIPGRTSALSLSHSDWDFKGNKKNGSLKINFRYTRTTNYNSYNLYYDITGKNIDPSKSYLIGFANTFEEDEEGSWTPSLGNTDVSEVVGFFGYRGHMYLVLNLLEAYTELTDRIGKKLYIDDLSISVEDTKDLDFGNRTYIGGTSFSAPIVAAAIARLAVMYPNDNALTRRQKIVSSVRELDTLKGKCVTNGTLDISKFASLADVHVDPIKYRAESIELNKTSAKLHLGKTLKLKAEITPVYADNTKVKWTVSNTKYATVSAKGVVTPKKAGVGHTVKVTATSADKSGVKAVCKVKIIR